MEELQQIKKRLDKLEQDYYKNNFSTSQDFQKYSRFNTRLKIPNLTALPDTCEKGELSEFEGNLYICSAQDTWTISGTQS